MRGFVETIKVLTGVSYSTGYSCTWCPHAKWLGEGVIVVYQKLLHAPQNHLFLPLSLAFCTSPAFSLGLSLPPPQLFHRLPIFASFHHVTGPRFSSSRPSSFLLYSSISLLFLVIFLLSFQISYHHLYSVFLLWKTLVHLYQLLYSLHICSNRSVALLKI